MYRTILVPLDGSERAEAILPHAEELAKRYDSELILMQVVETSSLLLWPTDGYPGPSLGEISDQLVEQANVYLADLQRRFREKGLRTRTLVKQGSAVESIVTAAEEEGADLVALASHGRSGLGRVFYGSVAAGVLHRIDRPLLLIRSQDRG